MGFGGGRSKGETERREFEVWWTGSQDSNVKRQFDDAGLGLVFVVGNTKQGYI